MRTTQTRPSLATLFDPEAAPDRVLVQAASRAWYGTRDRCIYRVGGRPVVARTIERLREALPGVPLEGIAPSLEHRVHPKYATRGDPSYSSAVYGPEVHDTPEELAEMRRVTREICVSESTEANEELTTAAGNELDFRYELARRRIPRGSRVLDIACGFGHDTAFLADGGLDVLGGDLDEEIVAGARERYGEREGVELRSLDVLDTGLPDDSFDHVVRMGTIEHVDVERYLAEMDRILRPGRTLFVVTSQSCAGAVPLVCWHHVELGCEELRELVSERLDVDSFVGIEQGCIAYEDDPTGSSSFVVARSGKRAAEAA